MDEFYRVPLSTAEATVAVAALRVLCAALQDDGVVSDIAPEVLESAAARIEAELPEFLHPQSERLRTRLCEILADTNFLPASDDQDAGRTAPSSIARSRRLLQHAQRTSGLAEIEYYVAKRNEWTVRRVLIDDVYETGNGWYLSGECQLRRDHRLFRLEHIRAVRPIEADRLLWDADGNEEIAAIEEEFDPFNEEGKAE